MFGFLLDKVPVVQLDKVLIVQHVIPHLPGLNCNFVPGGMTVPFPSHLEEGVDGEVVHLVYNFESLTPKELADKTPGFSAWNRKLGVQKAVISSNQSLAGLQELKACGELPKWPPLLTR